MTIAAIQDGWVDPASREAVRSCAMIITEPNRFVAEVHDRMPVILEAKDFEQWDDNEIEGQEQLPSLRGSKTNDGPYSN
jgi:putative SOS response-associated peptidase YedK